MREKGITRELSKIKETKNIKAYKLQDQRGMDFEWDYRKVNYKMDGLQEKLRKKI